MKFVSLRFAAVMTFACVCGQTFAQGTAEDYRRAYALRDKYSASKVYYSGVRPSWIARTDSFWYVRNTPEGRVYVVVDAGTQQRTDLFNHKAIAEALAKATGKDVKPGALYLDRLAVDKAGGCLNFVFNNHNWRYNIVGDGRLDDCGELPKVKQRHWMEVDDEKDAEPVASPDGRYTAFVRENNIWVRETATGKERQLSIDGTLGNYYSAYIRWSPDGKKVAACKIRPAEKRYVYYVESSPSDQLQPKLHKQEYAKPGDELRFKVPCIFDVETGRAIVPSTELFSSQYDLWGPDWSADSRSVTFEYNQRGHQVYRVLELSAETGAVRTLIEETSKTYVNYPMRYRYDLSDGRHIIWASERDNYNHLYMYDRTKGKAAWQITKGKWYVRSVIKVDEQNRQIYFSANGVVPGEDPYLIRYYRIGFDGKNMTCLTPVEGMHEA